MLLDDSVNSLSEEVRESIFPLLTYVAVVAITFLFVVCVCSVKSNSKEDESERLISTDFAKATLSP